MRKEMGGVRMRMRMSVPLVRNYDVTKHDNNHNNDNNNEIKIAKLYINKTSALDNARTHTRTENVTVVLARKWLLKW